MKKLELHASQEIEFGSRTAGIHPMRQAVEDKAWGLERIITGTALA